MCDWESVSACYPEGNFRTNQLLDVSMSLSPLSPIETSDLHVSTVGDLPSKFPSTSTNSGLAQHLSGPTTYTLTLVSETQVTYVQSIRFHYATVHLVCTYACMYDRLLGPCFKTGRNSERLASHRGRSCSSGAPQFGR